ncbi:MAG: penicillin-binding protein activator [Bacteroidales bacterium]|nr:penicillin-binding protein activator [Bacteroidales bacterium]
MKRILGFLIVVFFIASCCNQKKEVYKIGAILPLSGDVAVYGKNLQNGINLAFDEYILKNPNAKKIELIYEDSKADPKIAVNAFTKLTSINKCNLILGGFSSSEVLSMAPIAERNKVVLISPTASSPKITYAGEYIFRTTPSDNFDGEIMAKFAFKELQLKNVALLYVNNDYGLGISKVFKIKFEELGGNIVAESSFEIGSEDFKTHLLAIKNAKPDGLYIIASSEIGNVLKQKTELAMDFKVFTVGLAENPNVINIAGKGADSVYYSYPAYQIESSDSIVSKFVSDYMEKYGIVPDVLGAYGYDLMNIVFEAIEGNYENSDKIKNALYSIKDFPGVTGNTTFDNNGDISKTAGIKMILDGEFKWYINNFK